MIKTRLADDFTLHNRIDLYYLPEFAKRSIVIGGPGSGKSTLAQRLTYALAKQRKLVVHVRLKLLAKLLEKGEPFDKAVLTIACDGFGESLNAMGKVLTKPEYLIADGLDECDPRRHEVAERMKAWCDRHAFCRVVVTTRPVGHDSGLLPGFQHFELLPLDRPSIEAHSRRLFEAAVGDKQDSLTRWCSFMTALEEKRTTPGKSVRTLAARNPLLLGFLVRLAIDGRDLVRNRAELFEEILQLMAKTADSTQQDRPSVSSNVAHRALDIIGWHLTESPLMSVDALCGKIEDAFRSEFSALDVSELACAALQFWEASRVLERLTAGHLEAVVFVHPALGEFTAARYVAQLEDGGFYAWLHRVRRMAQWYQTIVLAAGIDQRDRVIRTLLTLDNPLDPRSTEAMTAASALAESGDLPPTTQIRVVESLLDRLKSPIPLVSIESATALLPISGYASDIIGDVATVLLEHEYEWTRLAGLALQVASGGTGQDLDNLEDWLRTFDLAPTSVLRKLGGQSSSKLAGGGC